MQNRTRNKEVAKIGNDVIVRSFLKIAQQLFGCEYLLLIPIDVQSFKLIEGQIRNYRGWYQTPLSRLRMSKNHGQDKVNRTLTDKLFSYQYHKELEDPSKNNMEWVSRLQSIVNALNEEKLD